MCAIFVRLVPPWTAGIALAEDSSAPARVAIRLTHVCWSDNLLLAARCKTHLMIMGDELTTELRRFGLSWKPEELFSLRSGPCLPAPLPVGDVIATPVLQLKLLGTCIDSRGGSHCAVDLRLAQATAAFAKHDQQLTSRNVPLRERFAEYRTAVVATILHSAGGWVWGKGLHSKLRGWEGRHLRYILRAAPKHREECGVYMQRSTRAARTLYLQVWASMCLCFIVKGYLEIRGTRLLRTQMLRGPEFCSPPR